MYWRGRTYFAVNSNLGLDDRMIDKLIGKINKIEDEDRVNEFIIFTSVDTWGEQAEYIRNGLEFNRIWDNMNKILEKCPRVNLTIMSTYNALSVPNYHKLIEGVYGLKEKYLFGRSSIPLNEIKNVDFWIEIKQT